MPDVRPPQTKEELVKDFRTGEILAAARRVIVERGVADASVERIAHEAGVAKGTIYLYFKNKETLLARTAEHSFRELMESSRQATQRARGSVKKLEALVTDVFEHSADHRAFFQALAQRPGLGPEGESLLAHEIGERTERYVAFIAGIIERGTRAGELRDVDSRRAARFLVEMLRGAISARNRDPEPPNVEKEARAIVDFFLHGAIAQGGNR